MSLEDELQAMLRKARRYVDSAEALATRQDYDSAVSRLYYAMFYCAEALLWLEVTPSPATVPSSPPSLASSSSRDSSLQNFISR